MNDARTLDDRLRHARQTLALVSIALDAVVEQGEKAFSENNDRLHHAAERASELAIEALADLEAIDLPRPIMDSHQDTTNAELIAALQEYTRGGREIQRKANQFRAKRLAGGVR